MEFFGDRLVNLKSLVSQIQRLIDFGDLEIGNDRAMSDSQLFKFLARKLQKSQGFVIFSAKHRQISETRFDFRLDKKHFGFASVFQCQGIKFFGLKEVIEVGIIVRKVGFAHRQFINVIDLFKPPHR